jgi:hypothetical protein
VEEEEVGGRTGERAGERGGTRGLGKVGSRDVYVDSRSP